MDFINKMFGGGQTAYGNLSIVDYQSNYFKKGNHVLVDVRTTGEFRDGHIPGAINIPLDQLQANISKVPQGKPVVVVCASGNRSRTGANIVAGAGYKDVFNLQGGTMMWMMGGNKVDK